MFLLKGEGDEGGGGWRVELHEVGKGEGRVCVSVQGGCREGGGKNERRRKEMWVKGKVEKRKGGIGRSSMEEMEMIGRGEKGG